MTIHIEALTFHVIIGVLDFERDKPQRVIIELETTYDYTQDNFIDYSEIVTLIQDKMKRERYTLLEDALLGLEKKIHTHYPDIENLFIKISKPDIISECRVSLSKTWNY